MSNGTTTGASANSARPSDGASAESPILTTRQGHPVYDNQNSRTVGERGPVTLENYHFIEKITHFDRERIPERVVHARGAGAHGFFEAYGTVGGESVAAYTRAKLFQEKGKRTPVFVRFSTVIHGGTSPETLRDPAGSRPSSTPRTGTGTWSATTCRSFSSATPSSSPTLSIPSSPTR